MKLDPSFLLMPRLSLLGVLACSMGSELRGQGFYYELQTVASSGGLTSAGDTIASFRSSSVNEAGIVAIAAQLDGATAPQGIFISGSGSVPQSVGLASDSRSTGFASINSSGKIVAHEQARQGTPRPSYIRVWDAFNPNVIPSPLVSNAGAGLSSILSPPSISNDGTVLFPGFSPRRIYLNTGTTNQAIDRGSMAPNGQPWVADNFSFVLREGTTTNGTLKVDSPTGPLRTLATAGTALWPQIGDLPGISETGKVVAFAGEDSTTDEGIYLWIDEPGDPDYDEPIKIIGFPGARDGLGYDDDGDPVVFDFFDMTQRVGVAHHEAGPVGIEGDEILVCFIAKPKTASFTNPHTGFPMLFTDQPALWVVHLTPSRDLTGTQPIRLDVKTSPMPVIQVGDFVDGEEVTAIYTYDPIAFAEQSSLGVPRITIGPADHHVVCEVATAQGTRKILKATQLDTDFDGLFDHWEKPNGGIDVNRDGTVDLVLADYGADPFRKDAFFEIDWSIPWKPESYTDTNGSTFYEPGEPFDDVDNNGVYTVASMAPLPQTLQHLVDRFANAPVANPVGPDGITAHIDAGITRSINMPSTATLEGGDEMVDPVTGKLVTLVYSNDRKYQRGTQGATDRYGAPFVEQSAKVMRDRYFGLVESNARELAFRHIMICVAIGEEVAADLVGLGEAPAFADRPLLPAETFTDTDGIDGWFEGDVFEDGNNNGVYDLGERFEDIRPGPPAPVVYDAPEPFMDTNGNGFLDDETMESARCMPGNSILIGLQGRHDAKNGTTRVYFPNAGVSAMVPAPAGILQISTLYHEVGHLMTLNHGGSDYSTGNALPTPKPDYRSIMNYRYGPYPDQDGTFILDYSSVGGPGTFNDWAIFRMDFARYFDVLGDQQLGSRYSTLAAPRREKKLTVRDLEATIGAGDPALPIRIDPILPNSDLVDADGDGLVFLVELALGRDPAVSDSQGVFQVAADTSVNPVRLSLIYPRDSTRTDLTTIPQYSADLISWTSAGVSQTLQTTVGDIETIKAEVDTPQGASRLFMRLSVKRVPTP